MNNFAAGLIAFFFKADLLLLTACEGGLESKFESTRIIAADALQNVTNSEDEKVEPNFDWAFGFRIGAGFQSTYCPYDGEIEWTHFDHKSVLHEGTSHGTWKLQYDTLDFNSRYCLYDSCCFLAHVLGGLRFAHIHQEIHSKLDSTSVTTMVSSAFSKFDDEQKMWALGPKIGIGTQVPLRCCLTFYGNLSGGVLFGEYDAHFHDINSVNQNSAICIASTHGCIVPAILDFQLGLLWQYKRLHLKLGFEEHKYFNFNQICSYGNLDLYGFHFGARF